MMTTFVWIAGFTVTTAVGLPAPNTPGGVNYCPLVEAYVGVETCSGDEQRPCEYYDQERQECTAKPIRRRRRRRRRPFRKLKVGRRRGGGGGGRRPAPYRPHIPTEYKYRNGLPKGHTHQSAMPSHEIQPPNPEISTPAEGDQSTGREFDARFIISDRSETGTLDLDVGADDLRDAPTDVGFTVVDPDLVVEPPSDPIIELSPDGRSPSYQVANPVIEDGGVDVLVNPADQYGGLGLPAGPAQIAPDSEPLPPNDPLAGLLPDPGLADMGPFIDPYAFEGPRDPYGGQPGAGFLGG